ncbi:hypothetical protein KEM09_21540 [Carboxylicivirga mesophila]|uniref:Uncharacterized protein n=1 Tax=Carboxylicivirga mesophila TaxID=1166478 RepID=A0ABS5KGZ4_9BACT|nr:hypothetical protein [Carboxylicivirga mesophila]MBS2214007.1 hypothetical protein [Carboxylicivirga mesophila]
MKINPNLKKYIGEGLLIVFSVLFALFINQSFDDYRTHQKKTIAQESILKELRANQAILANWQVKHTAIKQRLTSVIEGQADSLKSELQQYDYLNLGVLTNNEVLIDAFLTNTAWESARATGIITEFDFETIQQLTLVYDLQAIILDRTTIQLLDYLFAAESNDITKLDRTLVQLQLRLRELTGQEISLSGLYKEAIEVLEK